MVRHVHKLRLLRLVRERLSELQPQPRPAARTLTIPRGNGARAIVWSVAVAASGGMKPPPLLSGCWLLSKYHQGPVGPHQGAGFHDGGECMYALPGRPSFGRSAQL